MDDFGDYRAEDIQVLNGLEAVRRRPGMYLGDRVDNMLWEIISNAVDETLLADSKRIEIHFDGTRATVEDFGGGISTDLAGEPPRPLVELIMTTLHGDGKYRPHHVHLRRGLHGVGAAAVNAVSSECVVDSWHDGWHHEVRFARGEVVVPTHVVGRSTRTGTRVSFVPDPEIWKDVAWDIAAVQDRARELAALRAGLTVVVDDATYHYATGFTGFVEELAGGPVVDPLRVFAERDGVGVDLAVGWTMGRGSLRSFVNYSASPDGSHVSGLFEGIRRVFAKRVPGFARSKLAALRKGLAPDTIIAVHVMLDDPRFQNPTKDWLANPEIHDTVADLVELELAAHFERAPAMLDRILLDRAR